MPARVLHEIRSFGVASGTAGYILNYHKHLDPARVQIDYLYHYEIEPNRVEEARKLGAKVYYVPLNKPRKIKEFFADHVNSYDILHSNLLYGPALVGRYAKAQGGIKHIVVHSHQSEYSTRKFNAHVVSMLSRLDSLYVTNYVACSLEASKLFRGHKDETFILKNAIDIKAFAFDAQSRMRIRSELGIAPNTILLGNVGRLQGEKNQAFLLEVMRLLTAQGANYKLVFVGSGIVEQELRDMTHAYGLDDVVKFLGIRYDMPAVYSALDVFVLPSFLEGAPLVSIEAAANGLPCIQSTGVTKEVMFSHGLQLPIDNPNIWVDTVRNLDLVQDAERSKATVELKNAGFDIYEAAEQLMQYYENLAKN